MKQLQRKRGRAETGRRSSSLCTLTATELGDSRQVWQGRRERGDANACGCDVQGRTPENFVLFSRTPSPWGLVRNTLSPDPRSVIPSSGLPLGPSAVPGGWKKGSAAGRQTPPADPSFPPAHPYPTALLLSDLFSPAPGWARSASLQPPREPGRASRGRFSAPSP